MGRAKFRQAASCRARADGPPRSAAGLRRSSRSSSAGQRACREPPSSNSPSPRRRIFRGPVVGVQDPSPTAEMDNPDPLSRKQLGQGSAQCSGRGQRQAGSSKLTDMRQQAPEHLQPRGCPACGVHRIGSRPDDARAVGAVKPYVQAVLRTGHGQSFAVDPYPTAIRCDRPISCRNNGAGTRHFTDLKHSIHSFLNERCPKVNRTTEHLPNSGGANIPPAS